ncbi:MAG: alkene reductase [Rhodocyclaceae bacterium]|nr:alkene reductase [Rhodocyclaceae bacterium]
MSTLFHPLEMGDLNLPNRIVMAPLTRCRAGAGRVPHTLNAKYYSQRASAGLILTEATSVSPMGVGYPDTPGIWSDEQVHGWKLVTHAVHAMGGRIFLQLWHVGRISHPAYLDGAQPVAPSAIAASGHVSLLRPMADHPLPRALATDELPEIVAQFRKGAENAKAAGFDGVEVHNANGYLLDQFLQSGTNQRTDAYGASIENRVRLPLEVVDAVIDVWGAGRVGVHISPRGDMHDMTDSDPLATFGHFVRQLDERNIAFIFARESLGEGRIGDKLKQLFAGVYIANEGFNAQSANDVIAKGEADAVAFGKDYIASPDLVERLAQQQPLNRWEANTFYGPMVEDKAHGYTDYPALGH